MNKIKNFTILILFITCIILFLTKGCGNNNHNTIVEKHDTTIVHTVDTIKPAPIYVTNTITKFKPIYKTIIVDRDSHIVSILEDSIVHKDVIIKWTDTIQGTFIGKKIDYKLLIPREIIKKDIITIKETKIDTIIKHPKFTLFAGGIIGGNKHELSTIEPIGGFSINGKSIFYGYNLVNQTHNIGFTVTFFKSKK